MTARGPNFRIVATSDGTWCVETRDDSGCYTPMIGGFTHQRWAGEAAAAMFGALYAISVGVGKASAVSDLIEVLTRKES